MKKLGNGYKRVKWLFGKEIKIPEEWEVKTFNEIFDFLRTGTNSRSNLNENGDIQYIHYGDIHTKWHLMLDCKSAKIPSIENDKIKNLPFLKDGDLIIADASEDHEGSGTSILLKNTQNKRVVSGLHTVALRDNSQITQSEFRAYITSIKFVKIQIIAQVTGISVFGLSKTNLKKMKIPIPLLSEQQKIASILSGVDALIESTQQTIKKTEQLKKGLMQDLLTRGIAHTKFKKVRWFFRKEIKIPVECVIKKLSDLTEKTEDIVAGPFGSNLKVSDYVNKGIPIIRLQNIERNEFINKNIQFINNKKAKELKYHSYKSNDLVLAKLGEPIGKTCKIPKNFPEGIVVADVVRIRPSPKKSNQNFIEYVLNSKICDQQHSREKIGTTRPRVNLKQIRDLQFSVPPLQEQTRIASILSGVDAYIQKNHEYKKKMELLKKGLMQKLLTGQIRVQVDH